MAVASSIRAKVAVRSLSLDTADRRGLFTAARSAWLIVVALAGGVAFRFARHEPGGGAGDLGDQLIVVYANGATVSFVFRPRQGDVSRFCAPSGVRETFGPVWVGPCPAPLHDFAARPRKDLTVRCGRRRRTEAGLNASSVEARGGSRLRGAG